MVANSLIIIVHVCFLCYYQSNLRHVFAQPLFRKKSARNASFYIFHLLEVSFHPRNMRPEINCTILLFFLFKSLPVPGSMLMKTG